MLGVHENTIRNWEARGLFRAVHLPGSGYRRFAGPGRRADARRDVRAARARHRGARRELRAQAQRVDWSSATRTSRRAHEDNRGTR